MSFVVDSSVVVSWCFGDETSISAEKALTRLVEQEAIAPSLLWFDVRNALHAGERRKRLTRGDVDDFLARLDHLPVRLQPLPASAPYIWNWPGGQDFRSPRSIARCSMRRGPKGSNCFRFSAARSRRPHAGRADAPRETGDD